MHAIRKLARIAAIGCAFTTVVLSFAFGASIAETGVDDGWGHLLAYAAIAFSAYFGWFGRLRGHHILVILVAAGGAIEILQGLVGRTPTLSDWAADALGAFAGLTIAALLRTLDQTRRARLSAAAGN